MRGNEYHAMIKFFLVLLLSACTITLHAQTATKTVAQDGTGDYTTVQAALDAVPLHNQQPLVIYIKKGIYKEKLHLDSTKDHITLIGEDENNTIITYADHAGGRAPNGDSIRTFTSYSCSINASDFRAEHLTFQNTAGPTAGQAVALAVKADRASFIHCRMLGYQDTLLAGSYGPTRQYYRECYIEGSIDFIFGYAAALFYKCHIHSNRDAYITAASTIQTQSAGYVFKECKITADSGVTKVYLGRPWRPFSSVTYINCYLGGHILPQGWDNWGKTTNEQTARYAEYKNYGPGANTNARVKWARQLTKKEAAAFTPSFIYGDWKFKL
ncbi:pectin esterase [Chitinophaga sp. Cy-1792]|nr:pectin esterase [Chitinophaga sp. Cy-1792]